MYLYMYASETQTSYAKSIYNCTVISGKNVSWTISWRIDWPFDLNLDAQRSFIVSWVASGWSNDRAEVSVPGDTPEAAALAWLCSRDFEPTAKILVGTRVAAENGTMPSFSLSCMGSEVIPLDRARCFFRDLSWTDPTTKLRGNIPEVMVWPWCWKG